MNRLVLFLSLFVLLQTTTIAQYEHPETEGVREALMAYINGRNNGDTVLLRRAFYPEAELRYIRDGALKIWPVSDYIQGAKAGQKIECLSTIVSIDIEGNAAQAKIEIVYPQRKFVDYLNLLQKDGVWRIAVKTFSRLPVGEKRVLFVLTSHEALGSTERKTGLHLGEVSHVYRPLYEAGIEVDFVSPAGGSTYTYGVDLNDPATHWLLRSSTPYYKLTHALRPDQVDATQYDAIYYVGGHGTMWDLPDHAQLNHITQTIYENNGVVAAVCHGPSGLVNVKLSDGRYLVQGKRVTSFTDQEERATGKDKNVPFLLESTLKERGATFVGADNWQKNVVVDGRLITGQNPASADELAQQLLQALQVQP